jgi:hypothetical protein
MTTTREIGAQQREGSKSLEGNHTIAQYRFKPAPPVQR